ncbi:MAG: hypothetical protein V1708_05080, partial [Candidatus Micrarchaeota archaeon]
QPTQAQLPEPTPVQQPESPAATLEATGIPVPSPVGSEGAPTWVPQQPQMPQSGGPSGEPRAYGSPPEGMGGGFGPPPQGANDGGFGPPQGEGFGPPPQEDDFKEEKHERPKFKEIPADVLAIVPEKDFVEMYCFMTKWKAGGMVSNLEAAQPMVSAAKAACSAAGISIDLPDVSGLASTARQKIDAICSAVTVAQAEQATIGLIDFFETGMRSSFEGMRDKMEPQFKRKREQMEEKIKAIVGEEMARMPRPQMQPQQGPPMGGQPGFQPQQPFQQPPQGMPPGEGWPGGEFGPPPGGENGQPPGGYSGGSPPTGGEPAGAPPSGGEAAPPSGGDSGGSGGGEGGQQAASYYTIFFQDEPPAGGGDGNPGGDGGGSPPVGDGGQGGEYVAPPAGGEAGMPPAGGEASAQQPGNNEFPAPGQEGAEAGQPQQPMPFSGPSSGSPPMPQQQFDDPRPRVEAKIKAVIGEEQRGMEECGRALKAMGEGLRPKGSGESLEFKARAIEKRRQIVKAVIEVKIGGAVKELEQARPLIEEERKKDPSVRPIDELLSELARDKADLLSKLDAAGDDETGFDQAIEAFKSKWDGISQSLQKKFSAKRVCSNALPNIARAKEAVMQKKERVSALLELCSGSKSADCEKVAAYRPQYRELLGKFEEVLPLLENARAACSSAMEGTPVSDVAKPLNELKAKYNSLKTLAESIG